MGFFDSLTPVWHLSIYENRIAIVEPKTGKSAERKAEHEFSTAGLLITDDQILEYELGQLIRHHFKPRWALRYPVMEVVYLAQPITGQERKSLLTALLNAGASKVVLPTEG